MDFLFSHAAGKPIKAMRIAEIFDEEELYREASRFVLDNPGKYEECFTIIFAWTDLTLRFLYRWLVSRSRRSRIPEEGF